MAKLTQPPKIKINRAKMRRMAFAENYAKGMSGPDAARKAGFTGTDRGLGTQASRLLKNVDVQKHIQQAAKKASEYRVFGVAERREILRQIATGEIDQEITTETEGAMGATSSTQKRKPTAGERKAAIEHLDKLDGLMVEKHEHSGAGGAPLLAALGEADTDALRARLAALRAKKPTEKGTK